MEELQEADVLWPWPDTPPPSTEEEDEGSYDYDYDMQAAAPELYAYDATAAVDFSCEPFSEPAALWSWSASSRSSTLSALLSSSDRSDNGGGGGFFLSAASTVSPAGLELGATEESFLEADVLWPDTVTAADAAEADEFLWQRRRRSRRRIDEAAADAVFCGKREGCSGPLVASSPIDIPMATRGGAAAAHRRRP